MDIQHKPESLKKKSYLSRGIQEKGIENNQPKSTHYFIYNSHPNHLIDNREK